MNFEANNNGGWIVPDNSVIDKNTQIPEHSTIGDGCELGDGCKWLGVKAIKWLIMANVDGSGRQLKIVRHDEGVKIEAGCFSGDSSDFLNRADREGKFVYVAVVGAVVGALMELKQ